MTASVGIKAGWDRFVAVAGLGVYAVVVGACTGPPTPFIINGPGVTGNDPPTLAIAVPLADITRGQGDFFLIKWTDSDSDSNAQISFALVGTASDDVIPLIQRIDEDDTVGPDEFTVGTALIPVGTYHLRGIIDDGVNLPVEVFAERTDDAQGLRVVVTVTPPGQGPSTVPPQVAVTEPAFNLSVAQDDVLKVTVQPTELAPDPAIPFDRDSDITLYVLLDLDVDPNNDDPANPDPSLIIPLDDRIVPAGNFDAIPFEISIDLAAIPPRPGGLPYFIRATADDGNNPRVHQYAVGAISVVELAAGTVDLFDIGRTKSGGRFYGFNPGANLGSSISTVGDFDADSVADFVLVAQFGNPRNAGLVGEAYLVYGQNQARFGGAIGVNSVSETISGVIFEAPPVRENPTAPFSGDRCTITGEAFSAGITDVSFIRDLTGDGRPELLFGLPHVHGAYESMDFDPGDQDIASSDNDDNIDVVIRQGQFRISENESLVSDVFYDGVLDLTIDSANPGVTSGSDLELSWKNNGDGDRKWTLIKFSNVLDLFPDTIFGATSRIDITSVRATLEIGVTNTGVSGELFQAVTDFNSQTTFSTYAQAGGEPELDIDYIEGGLGGGGFGTFEAAVPDTVTVDVAFLVQELVNGGLRPFGDELRFIIVADAENGDDEAGGRSSEWAGERDRPTLRIAYDRINDLGSRGCYPDSLANNKTDEGSDDEADVQYYGGGFCAILDSANRDNEPRQAALPARLDTTSVALELVGQKIFPLAGAGGDREDPSQARQDRFARADNYAEEGHIAGARFTAGFYDCIDHLLLNQPARNGMFGQNVASIGDLNNDGLDEIIISAPKNEAYLNDLETTFGTSGTHFASTAYHGSILVVPGANYNDLDWRDKGTTGESTSTIPTLDQQRNAPFGRCQPSADRNWVDPLDTFQVFAEEITDELGGGRSAGDFNQDGLDDILCGAPLNDRSTALKDTGAVYILYGRSLLGDFRLNKADDVRERPPMLRVRGETPGDQIGWRQSTGLDVNGDRIDDIFFSSPRADFGNVTRTACGGDFNGDGVIDESDRSSTAFSNCQRDFSDEVFSDDACSAFDFDGDGHIDADDERVFFCVADGGANCCENLTDNGFVGVIFGGVFTDGDRTLSQLATNDLPGVIFFGAKPGHRAGYDVGSAGDFNQDGFGDILISVPGETRVDVAGRPRLGVVYLIFGGTHLRNTKWSLDQVGSEDLPGIVFLSPYVKGRPNEAAPLTVAFLGDINRDGFGDIAIGNPLADFIDFSFPQGPNATDAELGRRRDAGDAYIVYGNNFGSNRGGGS